MNDDSLQRLDAWVDAHFDDEVRFLQRLVQQPTDTPPGDNAPHAELCVRAFQHLVESLAAA